MRRRENNKKGFEVDFAGPDTDIIRIKGGSQSFFEARDEAINHLRNCIEGCRRKIRHLQKLRIRDTKGGS